MFLTKEFTGVSKVSLNRDYLKWIKTSKLRISIMSKKYVVDNRVITLIVKYTTTK